MRKQVSDLIDDVPRQQPYADRPCRNILPFAIECCYREPARRMHKRHQTRDAAKPQGIVFRSLDAHGGLFEQPAQQPRNTAGSDGVLDVAKRQRHGRIGIGHSSDLRCRGDVTSVEFQFTVRRRRERIQRRHRFYRKPSRLPRDQKQPVSLASVLDSDHAQHQKQVGDRAIRNPSLAAANNKASSVRLGCRLQVFRMGSGARLGDRNRRTDLAGRDARKPCGALERVRKTRNEESCRHLPRGKGARQPQQPGFRCNRLLGNRYGTIGVECCRRAGEADLEETCLRQPSERVGQDVVLRD
jgi:hypothetical protein